MSRLTDLLALRARIDAEIDEERRREARIKKARPNVPPEADVLLDLPSKGVRPGTWAGRNQGSEGVSQTQRHAIEDAMFTDDEALAAHNAFRRGDTSDRAVIGDRVYGRRNKRARLEAAS